MKGNKARLEGDIAFLIILIMMLLCMVFTGNSTENWEMNTLMFCVAAAAILITYFFSITAGLITDLIILFSYISWIMYQTLESGETIGIQMYFWVLWIPVTTTAFHFFTADMKRLQNDNKRLSQTVEELAMYDEDSGLENFYSYENECQVYMRLAERYKMPMVLLVWELRYENEVSRLLGRQKFGEQITMISEVAREVFRKEDSLFLLHNAPYLWGTIMFTNPGGEAIVIERLKKSLDEAVKNKTDNRVQIELRFGTAVYDNNKGKTPMEFMEIAKKRLSYDVPSKMAVTEETAAAKEKTAVKAAETVETGEAGKAGKMTEAVKAEEAVKAGKAVGAEEAVKTEKTAEEEAVKTRKTAKSERAGRTPERKEKQQERQREELSAEAL